MISPVIGEVTGPTRDQVEWVRERRPHDPTLPTARPVGLAREGAK